MSTIVQSGLRPDQFTRINFWSGNGLIIFESDPDSAGRNIYGMPTSVIEDKFATNTGNSNYLLLKTSNFNFESSFSYFISGANITGILPPIVTGKP